MKMKKVPTFHPLRSSAGVGRLAARVRVLEKQTGKQLSKRGSMNAGDTVEVDYFALTDLITYFHETREAACQTIKARDALHQVFFSSDRK